MIRRSQLTAAVAGLSLAAMGWTGHLAAQSAPAERSSMQALRQQVERRFEPFPLVDGFALRPKTPMRGVRSIEVTGGTIAMDGSPVTGAELRDRIGDDADLVLQLSYLNATDRRTLFGGGPTPDTGAAAPPFQPAPLLERPERPAQPDRGGRPGRRRDYVRIGSSVSVGPDEVVNGDVVAVGGSAHIEGQVHGDVVAVGGSVDLGPRAVVDQDVAVIGGSLHRAEGARVDGDVKEVGFGAIPENWFGSGNWRTRGWSFPGVSSTFALVSTLTRGAVLCLLVALVVLLAGAYVDQISLRALTEPFKAGAIGFLAQLLFVPLLVITILVLVVTIVGIPLLVLIPFIILGLGVVGLVGFTAVAQQLGAHIGRRLGWTNASSYLTAFAGVVTLLLPVLLARLALLAGGTGIALLWHGLAAVGLFVEYLAWTVGFGAVALVRFGKRPAIS